MYGYITVNKPELKFKEYDLYRSYYCGLCHCLGQKYGLGGKISLTYDMTFLTLLLTGLYEPLENYDKKRCIAHPAVKQEVRTNEITDYAVSMNVLMTYYKCEDDWLDEKKLTRKAYAAALKKSVSKITAMYPQKAESIKQSLSQLHDLEDRGETNIDKAASCFGKVCAQMFAMKDDEWSDTLKNMGFYLGKFIYILDAYEDLSKDIKAKRYNVLKTYGEEDGFDELCESILNDCMARCVRSFECLPIIENAELLRNILYSGVWTRFETVRNKRMKENCK